MKTSAKVDLDEEKRLFEVIEPLVREIEDATRRYGTPLHFATALAYNISKTIAALPAPRSDASAVELVLGYHKFADAVEHDSAVPVHLRGMASIAKIVAEQWLKKQGS